MFLILLLESFYSQIHIAADTTTFIISFHVPEHSIESRFLRAKPHIKKHSIFSFYFFAKPIEEPVMRGQFTTILVLCNKEQIHFHSRKILAFINNIIILFLLCNFTFPVFETSKGNINSVGVHQCQIIPCLNVLLTVRFCFAQGRKNYRPTLLDIIRILFQKLFLGDFIGLQIVFSIVLLSLLSSLFQEKRSEENVQIVESYFLICF